MPPTIISKKASNWVDRGEPAWPTIQRFLVHFFAIPADADTRWLEEVSLAIVGMVEADATEVHVADYLRSISAEHALDAPTPRETRLAAIAVWHIGKAAHVRDFAERVLRGDVPPNVPTAEPLSEWLAKRLTRHDDRPETG